MPVQWDSPKSVCAVVQAFSIAKCYLQRWNVRKNMKKLKKVVDKGNKVWYPNKAVENKLFLMSKHFEK